MPNTKEEVKKVLKISDRCDRCGAQAFVLANFTFCFITHPHSLHIPAIRDGHPSQIENLFSSITSSALGYLS